MQIWLWVVRQLLIVAFVVPGFAQGSHHYFAYGSNLSYSFLVERLKDGPWTDEWTRSGTLIGDPPFDCGVYELRDFAFSYSLNVEPFGDKGTASTIIPTEGAKVYGVLYILSDIHLEELDRSEAVPEAYTRERVRVRSLSDGELVDAWVYVGNPKYVIELQDPDPLYVELLVEAAKERGFPSEYIEGCLEFCPSGCVRE